MDIHLAAILSAGITVTELAGSEAPIRLCRQPVVAMLGRTATGPVNEPVRLGSLGEFTRRFGGPVAGAWLPDAVAQFFAAGGRELVVVRLVNRAAAGRLVLPTAAGGLTLTSRFPGSAESLRATVELPEQTGRLHITLQRLIDGQIADQEFFRDLSLDDVDDRFVGTELGTSRLATVADRGAADAGTAGRSSSRLVITGEPGCDGSPLTEYDLIGSPAEGSGLFALDAAEQIDFVYVPPEDAVTDYRPVFSAVASRYCAGRSALLVVDPPATALAADTSRTAIGLPSIRYWPPVVERRDPERRVPIGGALLGALAHYQFVGYGDFGFRAECTGIGRRYVADPAAQQHNLGALGESGVFVLAPRRDQTLGIHAATLYVPGLGRRCSLHTLRLLLVIERSIAESTRWVIVAENKPDVWLALSTQVSAFLDRLARGRLITADFRVRCDAITNAGMPSGQGATGFRVTLSPRELAEPLTFTVTQTPAEAHVARAAFTD